MSIRRICLFLLCLAAAAAQPPRNAPEAGEAGEAKFTSSTQLVVETISVRDKNGRPVEGLTARDFALTEDGKPQTIRFCEYQNLREAGITREAPEVSSSAGNQIVVERPGDIRYKDRRLLALYFDMTAMPIPDQMRALAAARTFVQKQMTPLDLMAVLTFSGGAVEVVQDFTADRNQLGKIIQGMIVGEGQGLDENPDDASSADTGVAFGQDEGEFNVFNTDRQLSALQTSVKMLGRLQEKKSLIYFASGLRLNGTNNQAQLNATINAAIRAGVSLWPIDARGLLARAPLGDATQGSPGGIGIYSGASAMAVAGNFQRSQDTLWTLAADTGGKAVLDNNDLAKGIVQAQQSVSSYYILGYYTSNQAQDGRFRRIRISLAGGLAATLDYRQGYFAGKEFRRFTATDKERQLEDALMLGDPITELTIAMEVNYFQLNRAEYFVPVAVKIPGRELALARRGGAEHTVIDFIGEVKDEFGSTITNVRDKVDAKLTGSTASELAKRPIEYDTGFTLLPGAYYIKMLARDAETGRIGTYQTRFVIPNLEKDQQHLHISSVILSSQRVAIKDALYNTGKDRSQYANPLVEEGQKWIPSVTRVFHKSRDLYVYLQGYQRDPSGVQPLVAYVSFYRRQTKALETSPLAAANTSDAKFKTVPLRFRLSLNQLPPGKYECQVTVLDPTTQKAAFWQAPIMLVP